MLRGLPTPAAQVQKPKKKKTKSKVPAVPALRGAPDADVNLAAAKPQPSSALSKVKSDEGKWIEVTRRQLGNCANGASNAMSGSVPA